MAKDTVDRIVELDGRHAPCHTDTLRLGCEGDVETLRGLVRGAAARHGVPDDVARSLVNTHGDAALEVIDVAVAHPTDTRRLDPTVDHVMAEVRYAARAEGAATLDDVLSRRTRIALRVRDAGLSWARDAAGVLAEELERDGAWADAQVSRYAEKVRIERGVLGLVGTTAPAAGSGDPAVA
jgi:glycerol-3-phosphate dehydrogenase